MEWVEVAGRTLAEAKDAALDQLGVDETDAEFVILSEPKPGLFGRTRGEARVRARVRPTQPRPKRGRERRPSSSRSRRGTADERRGEAVGTGSGATVDAVGVAEQDELVTSGDGEGPISDAGATARRRSRGGRRRGGDSDPSPAQTSSAQNEVTSGAVGDDAGKSRAVRVGDARTNGARRVGGQTEEEAPVADMTLEQQGDAARAFVADLVRTMGVAATVEVHAADEESVSVAVEGEGVGTLIGPGGSTLAALQELTRTYVQKITGGKSDRILVDVAGYRARRVAALQRFTRSVADEVVASGEARALEPMSAADRKVVHDTVNEIAGVSTRSEGEDPRRYIVLVPDTAEP